MRRFLFTFAFWLYVFVLLGLILHTSQGIGQVFNKYSFHYFAFIVVFLLFGFLYYKFIKYLAQISKYRIWKKEVTLKPRRKLLVLCLAFIVIVAAVEIFMRVENIRVDKEDYNINNFQPFVQSRLIKDSNPDVHVDSYGFRSDEITKVKP